MTSREITIAVWVALGAAVAALEIAGRFPRSPVPTFGRLLERAMRSPSGRVGILAGWLWIGLHYFSR